MRRNDRRRARDDIAIIGMSGRFPGAPSIERFWENLRDGIESITPFSHSELQAAGVDPRGVRQPRVSCRRAASSRTLSSSTRPSSASARARQRASILSIASSWRRPGTRLRTRATTPRSFPGSVGRVRRLRHERLPRLPSVNPEFMALLGYLQVHIGNDKDYLTTRVSYKLNLKGPSFSVQTACSTSLLAVAVAGDHLLSHQCDMALAGGVCVRVPQKAGYYFEPGGIFSPDGHCRVFDEQAAGVVFGNGVGVVVLRGWRTRLPTVTQSTPSSRAGRVNNDGAAKASYAAPSLEGQADVIIRAHEHAGVSADTITYVEAHGTGTSVGDPIEIAALTQAFRASTVEEAVLRRRVSQDERRAPGSGGGRGEPDQDRASASTWRDSAQP